jgi:hypothetical protein
MKRVGIPVSAFLAAGSQPWHQNAPPGGLALGLIGRAISPRVKMGLTEDVFVLLGGGLCVLREAECLRVSAIGTSCIAQLRRLALASSAWGDKASLKANLEAGWEDVV